MVGERDAMVGKLIKSSKNPVKEPDQEDLKTDLLMREVEEEVRREQMQQLWTNYGTYMLAAVVLLVAGVGGYQAWLARSVATAEAAGARYIDAVKQVEAGKSDDAVKTFAELAATAPDGYAALARLQLAAAHQKAGRSAEALAAYEILAKDKSASALLADFAQLQAAALRLDTADWTEMQNRLNVLAAETSTWRYSARELLGLSALKASRVEDARKTFQELLADRKAPPSIGQRAQIMMGQIVALELETKAALPASGNTPAAPADAPAKP